MAISTVNLYKSLMLPVMDYGLKKTYICVFDLMRSALKSFVV